jgi:ABC-type multidrug transport system fused ATPase/permease subunit
LLRPKWGVAFLIASAMHALGHGLLALAGGALAVALVGHGIPWGGGSTPPGGDGPFGHQVFSLAFVGLVAVFVKTTAGTYASFVQARIAGEVGGDLRLSVLEGLLSVHPVGAPRHEDQGGQETVEVGANARGIAALTDRVREVEAGLHVGVLGGLRAAAQLVPLVAIQIWMAPKLALAALLVFVPFAVLLARVRRVYKRASARLAREGDALLEASDEAVRHADLWRTYGAEARARATVAQLGRAITRRTARLEAGAAALSGANEVLGAAALACAIGAARAGWLGNAGGGGALVAFAIAFFLAYRPLRDLADARLALARAASAVETLHPVLHAEGAGSAKETVGAPDAASSSPEPWPLPTLELRGVRLAHGSDAPISFAVGAGEIVALCGPTGVGKTTLLRTLLGLEQPVEGEIHFGDARLAGATVGPRARPFAWVPQDAPLLLDTLVANVQLGVAEGDARAALEPIGAAHLLDELDGVRLGVPRAVSGGERQWIALARAIATGQPVLLLDEPTNGLDARAQARVLEGIARLRGKRSVVLVTHRPEPLAIADSVVHVA